jgi:ankyrin repeat protein
VRLLLKYSNPGPGPTVDFPSKYDQQTALIIAAGKGYGRMAELLMQAKGNSQHIDKKDRNGETALVRAARRSKWKTVDVILGYSPAINLLNNKSDGALHFAIKDKRLPIVKRMLDGRGGNAAAKQKDSGGSTPLHLAAASGINILAQELLDAGASNSVQDSNQRTPDQVASWYSYFPLANLISTF